VRGNKEGTGELPYYGAITAMQVDPIEKKPLYHYHPGSCILSLGFAGCNLRCPFCQNWRISQITGKGIADLLPQYRSPEAIVQAAQTEGFRQIAYTYSEPLIHLEFLLECMACAREAGIANIVVSNGCINLNPAEAILRLTDAVNIDLKCFSEHTYAHVLGGDLPTVLAFITKAWEMGVHLELTTLVVPALNDGDEEIDRCIGFIASLSPHIPWHLSAYHPAYTWKAPPTDAERLVSLTHRARKTLAYVYTGNIGNSVQDTACAQCGEALIRRQGYRIDTRGLVLQKEGDTCAYRCAYCGRAAPLVAAPAR
jgi:pyruvate formate lyase activating enzyme